MSRRSEYTEQLRRPRLSGGAVFGLILIALGMASLLENLGGRLYAENVLNLWPCALIALGILRLWNCGFLSVWGQLLVVGGALCLIGVWWNEAAIDVWWPISVVWVGFILAVRAFFPKQGEGRRRAEYTDANPAVTTRNTDEERAQ